WTLGLGASILLAGAVAIWEAKQRRQSARPNASLVGNSLMPSILILKFPRAITDPTRRQALRFWATLSLVGLAAIGGIYWLVRGAADNPKTIYEARNFYGTIAVLEYDRNNPAEHRRYFFSGATVHGKQFVDPQKRHLPVSYFGPHTGIGR